MSGLRVPNRAWPAHLSTNDWINICFTTGDSLQYWVNWELKAQKRTRQLVIYWINLFVTRTLLSDFTHAAYLTYNLTGFSTHEREIMITNQFNVLLFMQTKQHFKNFWEKNIGIAISGYSILSTYLE